MTAGLKAIEYVVRIIAWILDHYYDPENVSERRRAKLGRVYAEMNLPLISAELNAAGEELKDALARKKDLRAPELRPATMELREPAEGEAAEVGQRDPQVPDPILNNWR